MGKHRLRRNILAISGQRTEDHKGQTTYINISIGATFAGSRSFLLSSLSFVSPRVCTPSCYSGFRRKAGVIKCNGFPPQKGGHGPRRSMRRLRKLGTRNTTLLAWQVAFFRPDRINVHLAYKDVDLFPKGSSLELCSTKPAR